MAHDPKVGPKKKPFWITPGGEIESGEDCLMALQRELKEETGIPADQASILGCVGVGEHDLNWGGVPTHLHESFFFVRVKNVVVSVEGMTSDEKLVYKKHRWWSVEELRSSEEIFLPVSLPEIAESLHKGMVGSEPCIIDMTTPRELSE